MVDFRRPRFEEVKREPVAFDEVAPVHENREHKNSVDALSANPVNRAQYGSASHDHTIKLWDANTHQCLKTLRGHNDGVWSLNYLTDGRRMISASVDGTAKLWDSQQGACIQTLAFHDTKVYTAVVNDAMTMAASVGSDRKIAIWDLRNASQPVFVNEESTASVTACDFSVDQKAVITANFAGRVNVLDLETKEMRVDYDIMFLEPEREEDNLCYHLASVKNYPSDPQGGNVFVLSSGVGVPNVILYEGWHAEPLHRLETINKFFGHSAPIRHCEFSPDLSKLLSCCADHSMRVWDRESENTLKLLSGHTDLCTAGIWLNERTIVSGSWDCKIMLWNI